MKKVAFCFVGVITVLLLLLTPFSVVSAGSPAISNLAANPQAFNSNTAGTIFFYTLTDVTNGHVVLEIYNQANSLVRSIDGGTQSNGAHSIAWDGKNQSNGPVPEGSYTAKLNVTVTGEGPYSFVLKWGSYGTGDGQFKCPWGVALDATGNVYVSENSQYVTEQYNHRIQKFSSSGTFFTKWGSLGSGDSQFNRPHGVAVDAIGNVYVTEYLNSRIQKFSSDGTFITKWGSYGSGDGQFTNDLHGIALDRTGNVYTAEAQNNRIQKFSSDGGFITKWGSLGAGDGQFSHPTGVAVDATDNVYVTDWLNSRIQKFAPPAITTSAQSTVLVDNTAPTISYSGNAGTYTVDQPVNIICSATDSLSGIASSTCQDITGPAYSFPLGTNTFSATATDKAGNVGSASTSFTVGVDFNSLRNLVEQFVTKQGIIKSLQAKLNAAEAAAARGNANAKAGAIGAFINEVQAQSGKSMTPEHSAILISLANAL